MGFYMSLRHGIAALLILVVHEARAEKIVAWNLPAGGHVAQPSLSQTPEGELVLSWIQRLPEGGHRLNMSLYSTKGEWSPTRTIASGKNFFVNWADFPATQALQMAASGRITWKKMETGRIPTMSFCVDQKTRAKPGPPHSE